MKVVYTYINIVKLLNWSLLIGDPDKSKKCDLTIVALMELEPQKYLNGVRPTLSLCVVVACIFPTAASFQSLF